jgi:CBS domain containing-hemolysin-like protein
MLLGLSSILLLVLAAAFFVASEYALVSVRKTRIEQLVSEGNATASRVKFALEHLDRYIAAVQIGITIVTLALGALGEPVLGSLLEQYLEAIMTPVESFVTAAAVSTAIAFLIVTVLEIVLGEIVPKILARERAERVSLLLIRPLDFFVTVFRPLIWIVNALSNVVLRLLGVHPGRERGSVYTVEELEMLVTSSRQAGVLDRDEEVILRRVFDFGDLAARQVMRPRTEIDAIDVDASLDELVATMARGKHSRLPIFEGDLDHIVGLLHVKDVFLLIADM